MSNRAAAEKTSEDWVEMVGWPALLVVVLLVVGPVFVTGAAFVRMLDAEGLSFWASLNPVVSWDFLTKHGGWKYVLAEMLALLLAYVLLFIAAVRRERRSSPESE